MTEMPRYNPESESHRQTGASNAAPTAPPIMNTIYFMLLGAAVLQVVSAVFGLLNAGSEAFRTQITDQLNAQNTPGITPEVIDVTVAFAVGGIIVVSVLAVIGYIVIGLFVKKGMGWARIVGAILAVVALSQLIGLTMPGGIVTILQMLLGLAAMVLCFIQPAAGFFTARKNFRMASKVR